MFARFRRSSGPAGPSSPIERLWSDRSAGPPPWRSDDASLAAFLADEAAALARAEADGAALGIDLERLRRGNLAPGDIYDRVDDHLAAVLPSRAGLPDGAIAPDAWRALADAWAEGATGFWGWLLDLGTWLGAVHRRAEPDLAWGLVGRPVAGDHVAYGLCALIGPTPEGRGAWPRVVSPHQVLLQEIEHHRRADRVTTPSLRYVLLGDLSYIARANAWRGAGAAD